jgi:hypothetical protein
MSQVPQTPARRLSSASQGSAPNPGAENGQANGLPSDGSALDQEQGIKRKLESEEADNKRARQKTGAPSSFLRFCAQLTPCFVQNL